MNVLMENTVVEEKNERMFGIWALNSPFNADMLPLKQLVSKNIPGLPSWSV